jgi:hypothetical protein
LANRGVIEPFEMADIYWSHSRKTSIYEVTSLVLKLKSQKAKDYWGEVLVYLNVKKSGRKTLQ